MAGKAFDYTSGATPIRSAMKCPHCGHQPAAKQAASVTTIELVVRPGRKYGEASAGDRVLVDVEEYAKGPTRETLYTSQEHEQALATQAARAVAAKAPKTNPVHDAIREQLSRLGGGGAAKTEDAAPAESVTE